MAINRRTFSLAALGAFSASGISQSLAQESQAIQPEAHPKTGEAALARLKAGNERFVKGELRHPHIGKDWRKRLAGGQKPFATILGCSDSRVPPELLLSLIHI